ncbi:hypothetical protein Z967_11945 [Clostridium novyi A str. 4540]|uniref:hypothetical protein n=1 Tax=Clostridium novyi TaxID=1542 RepID=UPI0004D61986|nr:hypothetical protein [Clostridium novyi]KEH88970.1 hypothetical protein Z967_11945 [Clostridium novyi A str. 4540]
MCYCKLKNKEVTFYEEEIMLGNKKKIQRICSENHKVINGVLIEKPCKYSKNQECLQLKNRFK